MSLTYIGDQLFVYFGSLFLVTGIVGNTINVFVFLAVRRYRTKPCTFYFLIASVDNILYISIFLIARIVAAANEFDLTRTSLAWCRARAFFAASLSPISLTCSCLAIIDQYFLTSQHARLRQCSNIHWAHRIACIVIVVWCAHGSVGPVFYQISSVRCLSFNAVYAVYATIYTAVIVCLLPMTIMGVFGWLTYRNLRRTTALAREHADRQSVRMTLIQALLVLMSIGPYGINSAYRLITMNVLKSAEQQSKETFATTVVTISSYLYYTVGCAFERETPTVMTFVSGKLLCILTFIDALSSDSTNSDVLVVSTTSTATSDTSVFLAVLV